MNGFAQNADLPESELGALKAENGFTPWPVIFRSELPPSAFGLTFDTAGSETRKLQLQLAEPLSIQASTESRWLNAGSGSLLAESSISWAVNDRLSFDSGISGTRSRIEFQPLGSIHCQNGVLEEGSYRASGCYFTNDSNILSQQALNIGAAYEVTDQAVASINLFRESSNATRSATALSSNTAPTMVDHSLRTAVAADPLFRQLSPESGLSYMDTEVSGIDLEFKVGVSTDNSGDMQLGLQFSRVLEGNYSGIYPLNGNLAQWTLAEPVDSAGVSFDWRRNSFSGGIQGFYREPAQFQNRETSDSLTTFDVYFTWRTPWNASLSVGASNLLNSGADENNANDSTMNDPFEAVYGRIPYVRYQQDL